MKRVHSCPADWVLVSVIVARPLASGSGRDSGVGETVPSRVVADHAMKSVQEKVSCARVDVGRMAMDSSMTRSVVMDEDDDDAGERQFMMKKAGVTFFFFPWGTSPCSISSVFLSRLFF